VYWVTPDDPVRILSHSAWPFGDSTGASSGGEMTPDEGACAVACCPAMTYTPMIIEPCQYPGLSPARTGLGAIPCFVRYAATAASIFGTVALKSLVFCSSFGLSASSGSMSNWIGCLVVEM
jgi:hypothetical protein